MKKVLLGIAAVFALSAVNAQSGKNQLGIGAEVGIPTESGSKAGFGGSLKYMHGVGTAGQVTLSAGALVQSDKEDILGTEYKTTVTTIPILLGYRHYFSGFFIEPQAGYVSTKGKVKGGGDDFSASEGSFGYAFGLGYAMEQGLDLGVKYLNVAESGAKGLIVFRVAWNINLGGASSSK